MTSTISVVDLMERLEREPRPQIVDVRSPNEFATGHVPGAVNIPVEQVESRMGDLDLTSPVVLVCQSGQRASIAATRLAGHQVQVLEGGTNAWMKNGLCTVASASRWSLERQVRLGAGVMVITGLGLSMLHPGWLFLSAFAGVGLTFAGLTNICGMAALLARMPWNQPR